jgi:hypothetical protein
VRSSGRPGRALRAVAAAYRDLYERVVYSLWRHTTHTPPTTRTTQSPRARPAAPLAAVPPARPDADHHIFWSA